MNTADSEEMAQPLQSRGFTATADPAKADIIMMNTCTVRDQAEHRADSNLGRLREWKAENPERILIVAGCAATRWGDSIQKKYPFIDAVSPATKIQEFPEFIAKVLHDRWNWKRETEETFEGGMGSVGERGQLTTFPSPHLPTSLDPDFIRTGPAAGNWFGDANTAYVTIMRGCNYSCSYCIVPSVRGREIYRSLPEIVDDIRRHVAAGRHEVMLLGQTVNSYYYRPSGEGREAKGEPSSPISPRQSPFDFSDLLHEVQAIEGVETIRFMSPHPKHMRSKVISAMAECSKVARHLHLPVQSGSDRMLAQMKRLYTRTEYLDILEQLRTAMPDIKITTDVIVGYPGETEGDFEQTVSLFGQARFDGVFVFKYSPRPGTVSADQPDDIPATVKDERLQKVLALTHASV